MKHVGAFQGIKYHVNCREIAGPEIVRLPLIKLSNVLLQFCTDQALVNGAQNNVVLAYYYSSLA